MPAATRDQLPQTATPNEITAKGTAVLNGVSNVAISCPQVTASSLIFTQIIAVSGVLGVVAVTGRTPGVGFTVGSVSLATSTIAWFVTEP